MTLPIYKDCVTLVKLRETMNEITNAYVNSASGTWKLLDSTGVATIASGSLTYVADSNGYYYATVSGAAIVIGTAYIFEPNLNSGQMLARVAMVGQWYQGDG